MARLRLVSQSPSLPDSSPSLLSKRWPEGPETLPKAARVPAARLNAVPLMSQENVGVIDGFSDASGEGRADGSSLPNTDE
eukprot:scaffold2527_cov241-Pinguiococcus_pyrenoidosus.AAC.8